MKKIILGLIIFLSMYLVFFGIDLSVYQHIYQNVVRVMYVSEFEDIFGNKVEEVPYGSGVYIENEKFLTSYHLPEDKPIGKFNIIASGEKGSYLVEGIIEKYDSDSDLVLLKTNEPLPWSGVKIAEKESEFDEKIYFGGYSSFPLPKIRITFKMPHKLYGTYLDPIYFGDSGGGVFNDRGELEGIICLTFNLYNIPSLRGYAVPLEKIRRFLDK